MIAGLDNNQILSRNVRDNIIFIKNIEIRHNRLGSIVKTNNYPNKDKSKQNKWLTENLPNKHGLCIVLDGENGGSSTALVEESLSKNQIVAVSNDGDSRLLYESIITSPDHPLKDIHVVQKNIYDVLQVLNGPCISALYLDYQGFWTGNKTKKCYPIKDVELFFKQELPLNEGCLLMITFSTMQKDHPLDKVAKLIENQISAYADENFYTVEKRFYKKGSSTREKGKKGGMTMGYIAFHIKKELAFGQLLNDESLEQLNTFLIDKSYIQGYTPTRGDIVVHEWCQVLPPERFEHVYRWYRHISSFDIDERKTFEQNDTSARYYGQLSAQPRSQKLDDIEVISEILSQTQIYEDESTDEETSISTLNDDMQSFTTNEKLDKFADLKITDDDDNVKK